MAPAGAAGQAAGPGLGPPGGMGSGSRGFVGETPAGGAGCGEVRAIALFSMPFVALGLLRLDYISRLKFGTRLKDLLAVALRAK